jgi:hypothetical protein
MNRDPREPWGEPRRPDPDGRRRSDSDGHRFLALELWQQIVAGLAVAAIVAIVGLLLHHAKHSGAANSGSSQGSTPTPHLTQPISSPPISTQPGPGTTTWLDQLTPTSGEISSSNAAPDTVIQAYQPLSHELIASPAQNGNTVTYSLGGKYKTLNIEVAPTGNAPGTDTIFVLGLDDTAYPLNAPSTDVYFFAGLTTPKNWIINVSGVKNLQLALTDDTTGQGPPLLVSASLTS